MTTGIVKIAAIALVCAGILGLFIWRRGGSGAHRFVRRDALLLDVSDSAKDICESVPGNMKRALATSGADTEYALDVFITGDEKTANEPSLIKQLRLPARQRVLEGQESAKQLREKFLADVETQCDGLETTQVTPIFLAIRRVVEHLRAAGCGNGSGCRLWVQSDLEETVDRQIKDAIKGRSRQAHALAASIENEGVRVNICGLSETNGQTKSGNGKPRRLTKERDTRHTDRVLDVWKHLFTHPDLVSFEPFCPRS